MPMTHTDTESATDVIHSCRAMRRFESRDVPDDIVLELIDAAIRAPSGCNTQAQRFVVVRDPDTKRALAVRFHQSISWMDTVGQVRRQVLSATGRMSEKEVAADERTWRAARYLANHFEETPVVICACVAPDKELSDALMTRRSLKSAIRQFGLVRTLRIFPAVRGFQVRGACADIYPAVQNLLLTARAKGLGAVMTTPHIIGPPKEIEEILGLPKGVMLAAVIPIGYPKGRFGPVSRRPVEDFISYDRWGTKAA